jgi:hypothetical protein
MPLGTGRKRLNARIYNQPAEKTKKYRNTRRATIYSPYRQLTENYLLLTVH